MRRKLTQRDLFPGALEMMILWTVRRQPLRAYALVQEIKHSSKDSLVIEERSVYPVLQRLLRVGLLESRWETSSTNRRVRTYVLTPKSGRHLDREVAKYSRMIEGIARFIA